MTSDPRDSSTSEYQTVDPTPQKPWFQTPAGLAASVVALLAVAVVGFIALSSDSNETTTEATVPETTLVDDSATTVMEDTTSSTDATDTTSVEDTATTVAETTTTAAQTTTTALTVPPANGASAWEVIRNSPDLSSFRRAIEDSDLVELFQEVSAITVFAPSNDAFAALQAGVGGQAVLDDPDALRAVVLHHVTVGAIPAADLFTLTEVTTSNDDTLVIDAEAMTVGGAKIVVADVTAGPSILHVLDQVVLP